MRQRVPSLNINSDINDASLAYWGAYLISIHDDEALPRAVQPEIEAFMGAVSSVVTLEPSDNVGRGTLFANDQYAVILQNGVTGLRDGQAWLSMYDSVATNADRVVYHPNAESRGLDLYRIASALPSPNLRRTMLFAHSAGGCCAAVAQVRLANRPGGNVPARSVTFGCPRLGNFAATRQLFGTERMRYFADTDFVPFVPPRRSESAEAWAIINSATLDNWEGYEHYPPGWQITRDGALTQRDVPALPTLGPGFSIGLTAINSALFADVDHTIGAYVRLFTRFLERPVAPILGGNQVFPQRRRENDEGVIQPVIGIPVDTPDPIRPAEYERRLTVESANRWRARRVKRPYSVVRKNGRYAVVGLGEVVGVYDRRKKATKLARGLNLAYYAFLRRYAVPPEVLGNNVSTVFSA